MTGFLEGEGYEKWLAELGVSDAPLTRQGLATALRFFHVHLPSLSREACLAFLTGMDLHKPVREVTLAQPAVVVAFRRTNENPFRLFYTKAGTSVHVLGVNPASRTFRRFRMTRPVVVLESRCAAARDTWTDADEAYVASGGGIHYIIPESYRALQLVQ
jgi:hypothetical protein